MLLLYYKSSATLPSHPAVSEVLSVSKVLAVENISGSPTPTRVGRSLQLLLCSFLKQYLKSHANWSGPVNFENVLRIYLIYIQRVVGMGQGIMVPPRRRTGNYL